MGLHGGEAVASIKKAQQVEHAPSLTRVVDIHEEISGTTHFVKLVRLEEYQAQHSAK